MSGTQHRIILIACREPDVNYGSLHAIAQDVQCIWKLGVAAKMLWNYSSKKRWVSIVLLLWLGLMLGWV